MFCGLDSTALEISKLSRIFKIENINSIWNDFMNMDESFIDRIQ
jgi:hypothetical protein